MYRRLEEIVCVTCPPIILIILAHYSWMSPQSWMSMSAKECLCLVNEGSESISRVHILLDPIQDTVSHLVGSSVSIGSSWLSSETFLVFLMVLTVLKGIDLVLCKILCYWHFSDFFFILRLALGVGGPQSWSHSHHTSRKINSISLSCNYWCWFGSPGWVVSAELLLSPIPILYSSEESQDPKCPQGHVLLPVRMG